MLFPSLRTSSSHPRSIPSRCPRSSQSLHILFAAPPPPPPPPPPPILPPHRGEIGEDRPFFFPPPPGGLTQILSLQPAFPLPLPLSAFSGHGRGRVPPYGTPEGRETDHLAISTRVPLPGAGGRGGEGGRGDRPPLPVSSSRQKHSNPL